ncbi:MAG: hypothetical protein MPJ50_16980 [Pirellulales bacterium]|nr:hypothetical protein [Pirellulales bacterium]
MNRQDNHRLRSHSNPILAGLGTTVGKIVKVWYKQPPSECCFSLVESFEPACSDFGRESVSTPSISSKTSIDVHRKRQWLIEVPLELIGDPTRLVLIFFEGLRGLS